MKLADARRVKWTIILIKCLDVCVRVYMCFPRSRVPSPVLLSSVEEARSFLDAHLHPRHPGLAPARVLGLFSSDTDAGLSLS